MARYDLLVIGGGAAGYFCAVNAARLPPGLKVAILEKSTRVLSKVRISGGGRCNVTHSCFEIGDMVKRYPRGGNFVRKTFSRFFTTDTISWFETRGVKLKTEKDGRMFPVTDSSETIISCLLREAGLYNVSLLLQKDVKVVSSTGDGFGLSCADGSTFSSRYLCIATGGYPKSSMFDWLVSLGHSINDPVPSLFTLNIPKHPVSALMGLSVEEARIRVNGMKLEQTGPLLITHWGFSGPGVLRLSAWGARLLAEKGWRCTVQVNWLPRLSENELRDKLMGMRYSIASQKLYGKNQFGLPNRLWDFFLQQSGVKEDTRWADLPAKEMNRLIRMLNAGEFDVDGKTTYKEEFVTAGGIKPEEIDPATMMSKKIDGLFFAGEVMDVDGVTGGFNFQHAWTSGFIAASAIAERAL
ncbi:MAG: NAD(P)/FAD-dependent oxidoreductase [Chitinophagaceae bacterium]|nr:MAG: NAD(P)/FAD-dependent oxidoreductase [Chitinophagaceae bacterium]